MQNVVSISISLLCWLACSLPVNAIDAEFYPIFPSATSTQTYKSIMSSATVVIRSTSSERIILPSPTITLEPDVPSTTPVRIQWIEIGEQRFLFQQQQWRLIHAKP